MSDLVGPCLSQFMAKKWFGQTYHLGCTGEISGKQIQYEQRFTSGGQLTKSNNLSRRVSVRCIVLSVNLLDACRWRDLITGLHSPDARSSANIKYSMWSFADRCEVQITIQNKCPHVVLHIFAIKLCLQASQYKCDDWFRQILTSSLGRRYPI